MFCTNILKTIGMGRTVWPLPAAMLAMLMLIANHAQGQGQTPREYSSNGVPKCRLHEYPGALEPYYVWSSVNPELSRALGWPVGRTMRLGMTETLDSREKVQAWIAQLQPPWRFSSADEQWEFDRVDPVYGYLAYAVGNRAVAPGSSGVVTYVFYLCASLHGP